MAATGDTVVVAVRVSRSSGPPLGAFQADLRLGGNLLDLVAVTGDGAVAGRQSAPDTVVIAAVKSTGLAARVVTLTFRAKSPARLRTLAVVSPFATDTTLIPRRDFELDSVVVAHDLATATSSVPRVGALALARFNDAMSGSAPVFGDVNGDGAVNAQDVAAIIDIIVGNLRIAPTDTVRLLAANPAPFNLPGLGESGDSLPPGVEPDGSRVIDIADALAVAEYAVGRSVPVVGQASPRAPTAPPPRIGRYVAPNGTPTADGTAARPWDLASVLAGKQLIAPGDTVWLRGGTYHGSFTAGLSGTPAAPIVVRAYPGERATIGGTLTVNGADVWYWGFEVANTDPTTQDVMGVSSFGPRTRFINLVIHDHSGNGLGIWSEAPDGEVTGCILYNNGFHGSSSSSHGHGIYAQNTTGGKLLRDNVVFQSDGYGFHIYTENSFLRNFTLEGNVLFDNALATGANLLVGGSTPVSGLTVRHNALYQPSSASVSGLWIGRASAQNVDAVVEDNYVAYGWPALRVVNWSSLRFRRNVIIGPAEPGALIDQQGGTTGYAWGDNTWYNDQSVRDIGWRDTTYFFGDWLASTGYADTRTGTRPSGAVVVVRPNPYEAGRGHVAVYNWDGASSVPVDLSNVLAVGDSYEIHHVFDLWGAPVVSGTYQGGTVEIPMAAVAPPAPLVQVGAVPTPGPEFGAFLVTRAP
jgi:hypothetical protein